jgi:hypothetical protein
MIPSNRLPTTRQLFVCLVRGACSAVNEARRCLKWRMVTTATACTHCNRCRKFATATFPGQERTRDAADTKVSRETRRVSLAL